MSQGIKIVLLILLICTAIVEFEALLYYREKSIECEERFAQLASDAEAEAHRYAEASDEAAAQIEAQQKQIQDIMTAKIPKKCSDAIRWAIVEAKGFHAIS